MGKKANIGFLEQLVRDTVSRPDYLTFIRRGIVENMTGFPVSSLYERERKGLFAKRIKISERSSAWIKAEVEAVMKACIAHLPEEQIKVLVTSLEAARPHIL